MMLALYRAASLVGLPFILFYLNRRKTKGKEDPLRFNERLGLATTNRPSGCLIWLHAASVGESLSMLSLIERLLSDNLSCHLMVTTGTVSSAQLMAQRLPERAFHQYIPVDRLFYIRRFLKHWQPDIALWTESEFWPNIIMETRAHNIPMILINGRISSKSFAVWQRVPGLIKAILQCFTVCLGQSDNDVDLLNQLGSGRAKNLGNLKFSAPTLPINDKDLSYIKSAIGNRPLWLAASSHPGEEEIFARVHKKLKLNYPNILTIIVPRHATRGNEILRSIKFSKGLNTLRSNNSPITSNTEIYIADTMGELGLFFRLSKIVFMGKSLVPLGGQNPLEALRLGCAIIHGPHMMNFQWISEQMMNYGCSLQVQNADQLTATITNLLSNPAKLEKMISKGSDFVNSQMQVVDLVAEEIKKLMDRENESA